MMRVKVGKPLLELISLCYAAGTPPLLVGHRGIGKSEALKDAADQLGIGWISVDLSPLEPPDLMGLPQFEDGATHYRPPAFLPTGGRGLLVLEELNRCSPPMRAPCLQLLTARCLNGYRFPPGWLVAASINPEAEGYEVFELDPALLDRFVIIHVEPDRQEWLNWASRNGVHPVVIDYARSDSEIFNDPKSSPRGWKAVSDLLYAAAKLKSSSETLRAAVIGKVGETRGAAFLAFFQRRVRPLTADEVLSAYVDHRVQLQEWVNAGKLDLVRGTLMAVEKFLQSRRKYEEARNNSASWKHLAAFIEDLPGDLREEMKGFFAERDYLLPAA
jgi:hypothetical protein